MKMKILLIFTIKLIAFDICAQGSPSNPDSEMIQDVTDSPNQSSQATLTSTEKSKTKFRPMARAGLIKYEQDMESDLRYEKFLQKSPSINKPPDMSKNENQEVVDGPLKTNESNLASFEDSKIQEGESNLKGPDGDETTNNEKDIFASSDVSSKPENEESRNLNIQPPISLETKSSSDVSFLAEIINEFGLKIEKTLSPRTNFFISPVSIFVSMAMTYLGSDGNTKKQLEEALGLNTYAMHDSHLHENMARLFASLSSQNGNVLLAVANGMFLTDKFNFKPQYKKAMQDYYAAKLQNVDFQNGDSTVKIINQWVEESTRNMIKDFLKSAPNPATRLLLLNAVYFKGAWKTKFPKERTFVGDFHSLDGTTTKMRLMILYKEKFPYFHDESQHYSFIKLPYDGQSISMIIALPSNITQEPNLQMTHKMICEIQDKMISRRIGNLIIPKFNFDYSIGLKPSLQALGLKDLFDANADLTGIREEKDLYVSNILHKAVIEVTEEGTTAAAVTQVAIRMLSIGAEPDFIANHPFAFYIVDEKTGVILFQGKAYGSSSGAKQRLRQRIQGNTRVINALTSNNRSEYRNIVLHGNRPAVVVRGIRV